MLTWQFLFISIITLLRQIPQIPLWAMERKKKNRVLSEGKGLTALIYVLYSGIWILTIYKTYDNPPAFGWGMALSVALLVYGTGLRFVSLTTLGRSFNSNIVIEKDHKLITTGVYSSVRHPIWLGLIIETLGMIVFSTSFYLIPVWVGTILTVVTQIGAEDRALYEKLGKEAGRYQEGVPRMIPGIW